MKKTYIEPENTVVRISMERMIAQSVADTNVTDLKRGGGTESAEIFEAGARESVLDAWEEW